MDEVVRTMKLHLRTDESTPELFDQLTHLYTEVCNYISQYIFDNGFELRFTELHKKLYPYIRSTYKLKSQLTISAFKTVTAKYKAIEEQLSKSPYVYKDETGKTQYIPRTLEWMVKPVHFSEPQADLVRNRDYSFLDDNNKLSINTLGKRAKVSYDVPECFDKYFDGTWKFGTAKLVRMGKEWYFHIPMTQEHENLFDRTKPSHVVGIDRGLRFIFTSYDERGKATFFSGEEIMQKRDKFLKVRSELQSRGTKSAKRKLKKLSGRESRWMSDVNHCISKALVEKYGAGTLFVIEDLEGVSFNEKNLSDRRKEQRGQLRSWTFYQFESMLNYKAEYAGAYVLKVPANYTSQRCPKCGRIHKANRHNKIHEYICDGCGYRSNDDRIGAMNLQFLGTMYVSGVDNPRFYK